MNHEKNGEESYSERAKTTEKKEKIEHDVCINVYLIFILCQFNEMILATVQRFSSLFCLFESLIKFYCLINWRSVFAFFSHPVISHTFISTARTRSN